jgi:hypothetical protein
LLADQTQRAKELVFHPNPLLPAAFRPTDAGRGRPLGRRPGSDLEPLLAAIAATQSRQALESQEVAHDSPARLLGEDAGG